MLERPMMDLSSWFRRSLTRSGKSTKNPSNSQSRSNANSQHEEKLYGITEPLIEFVKTFTVDAFKNFPLQDEEQEISGEESPLTSGNVRKDLSEWQERHAFLVLSKVKEISQLRYMLCPRHLKERQFWKIYFKLVKSHVIEYELHAIQLEKLRWMATDNEEYGNSCEVEMQEAKPQEILEPPNS